MNLHSTEVEILIDAVIRRVNSARKRVHSFNGTGVFHQRLVLERKTREQLLSKIRDEYSDVIMDDTAERIEDILNRE